jgi:hypothetical protein
MDCLVTQAGATVSVKCGPDGIVMNGELRSRSLVFRTPPMTDVGLIATYEAQFDESFAKMTGHWRLVGGVLNERGAFSGEQLIRP